MERRLEQPRVLVIEDDPDTAMLVADALADHFGGDGIHTAGTIADALETNLAKIDLVLCDYNLPDGTGLDALAELIRLRADLPVILVTGQNEIETAIKAIRAGAYDYVIKSNQLISTIALVVEKNLAVWRIKQENERLQGELEHSLVRLKETKEELERTVNCLEEMALTDVLTGLSNRRHLMDMLPRMFAESARYQTNLSCLMIDLDQFKALNDACGHQAGDDLLEKAGRLIAENCRDADHAVRYGGDEFLVLMPQTDRDTAVNLAQRLMRGFEAMAKDVGQNAVKPSMSVGIACTTISRPETGEQLIVHADNALYAAKDAGKNRIMLCEADGRTGRPIGPTPKRRSA